MLKMKHRHYRAKRIILLFLTLILLVLIYFFKDASFVLRVATTIFFFSLFYFVDHYFDVEFKPHHYLFIIIIGISSLILSPIYYLYPNYDKIQHFIQPIMISAIVFYMVNKLKIEMKWKLSFTFFITVALLGLFEIGEYALDSIFDFRLQGVYIRDLKGLEKLNLLMDPLDDTMVDLVLGVLGAGAYLIMKGKKSILNLFCCKSGKN